MNIETSQIWIKQPSLLNPIPENVKWVNGEWIPISELEEIDNQIKQIQC